MLLTLYSASRSEELPRPIPKDVHLPYEEKITSCLVQTNLLDSEDLAVATILGEAESEGYEGMLAVANVIRNRMRLKYASDGTVAGTVLRPLQFSFWNSDCQRRDDIANMPVNDPIVMMARKAWWNSAHIQVVPPDTVLYHTSAKPSFAKQWPPTWAGRTRQEATVGAHVFYSDPA